MRFNSQLSTSAKRTDRSVVNESDVSTSVLDGVPMGISLLRLEGSETKLPDTAAARFAQAPVKGNSTSKPILFSNGIARYFPVDESDRSGSADFLSLQLQLESRHTGGLSYVFGVWNQERE
jgi:hypothetical protein